MAGVTSCKKALLVLVPMKLRFVLHEVASATVLMF